MRFTREPAVVRELLRLADLLLGLVIVVAVYIVGFYASQPADLARSSRARITGLMMVSSACASPIASHTSLGNCGRLEPPISASLLFLSSSSLSGRKSSYVPALK